MLVYMESPLPSSLSTPFHGSIQYILLLGKLSWFASSQALLNKTIAFTLLLSIKLFIADSFLKLKDSITKIITLEKQVLNKIKAKDSIVPININIYKADGCENNNNTNAKLLYIKGVLKQKQLTIIIFLELIEMEK